MASFICAPRAQGNPRKSVRSLKFILYNKELSYSLTSTFTDWQRANKYNVSLIKVSFYYSLLFFLTSEGLTQ